jgi:hypothetical protein
VTGSGDIVPVVPGAGAGGSIATISDHLLGAFAGLVVLVVIATVFITGEYRRGLIRTTLAATPHRGRVLAAKAIVIGGVTFLIGLAALLVAVTAGVHLSRDQGQYVLPVGWLTEARVIAGTAALLAVAAVLALAVGAMVRRSAAAVAAVIVGTVLPWILGTAQVPCRIWLDVLLVGGHCRRGHGGIRPLLMCLLHGIHDWPAGDLSRRVRA